MKGGCITAIQLADTVINDIRLTASMHRSAVCVICKHKLSIQTFALHNVVAAQVQWERTMRRLITSEAAIEESSISLHAHTTWTASTDTVR